MWYPLVFKPVYKDYLWGGRRIVQMLHRHSALSTIAESWEVSAHPEGMSIVEDGPLGGRSLQALFSEQKEGLLGQDSHFDRFPILVKILDAKYNLSVQVHPDDLNARIYGGEAKSEAWIVLDAAEEACAYVGLKERLPEEELFRKLSSREILSCMHTLPIRRGDVISIPGGRLHSLGAGNMVLEVQQSSNTTYRVYDYDRKRALHLEEAKRVIRSDDTENPLISPIEIEKREGYTRTQLLKTPLFIVEKWHIRHTMLWKRLKNKLEILFVVEGEMSPLPRGRAILLPAQCCQLKIHTSGGTLLRIFLT